MEERGRWGEESEKEARQKREDLYGFWDEFNCYFLFYSCQICVWGSKDVCT